jgi:ribonuclease HI
MELEAVLEAVKSNPGPLLIVSDSAYVVNCFLQHWYVAWKRRGWITANKTPVKNRDLWEPLIDLVTSRQDVQFEWVKGHSKDPGNDVADRLATTAATLANLS